jgi:antitoxin ChpS
MAVLKTLDLHTGSLLNLSLKNNSIVLTPAEKDLTLNDLLDGSPKQKLKLTEDDKAWLNTKAVGKEF